MGMFYALRYQFIRSRDILLFPRVVVLPRGAIQEWCIPHNSPSPFQGKDFLPWE